MEGEFTRNLLQISPELLILITGLLSLLGWVLKKLVNFVIKLTNQNQENTEKFVNTVNHHQTKFNASMDRLSDTIEAQTAVFKDIIKK